MHACMNPQAPLTVYRLHGFVKVTGRTQRIPPSYKKTSKDKESTFTGAYVIDSE